MAQIRLRLLHNIRSVGWLALLSVLTACGGGSDSQPPALPPSVAISPALVTTTVGAEFTFAATVERAADPTLTWSALRGTITQDGAYTAPLTQGDDTVTATLVADSSVTATARVIVNPLRVISAAISPENPRITVGSLQLFTAVVSGGDTTAVTWSVEAIPGTPSGATIGSISSDGLYTAPTALPTTSQEYDFKIVATTLASGTQVTVSTTVTVTTKPVPTVVIVDGSSTPAVPVVNGEVRFFHAQITGASLFQVSWNVDPVDPPANANSLPMPSVTPLGESTQFTARERPGVYRLRATVTDRATGTLIKETDRLVRVLVVYVCVHAGNPPMESDGVTPTPCSEDSASTTPAVTLSAKDSQQFSATVTTYDGATDATYTVSAPDVLSWTWSVQESTGGSVAPGTGLYTAPVRGGTYHVKATVDQYSRLRSASATVLVNGIKVTIDPVLTEVRAGSTVALTATVTDVVSAFADVTWAVQEGLTGGAVIPSQSNPFTATYTAPSNGGGKTYHVTATSVADPSVRAIATIRVLGVWTSAAAGGHHTLAVKSDGTLWAWGNNYYGQLGDGTTIGWWSPFRVGTDQNWVFVAAGTDYALGLKDEGFGLSLYAWGSNAYGQLGDGTFTDRNAPVKIGADYEWKAVSARGHHTVAIKLDGSLWAWGDNAYGQVGNGTDTTQPAPARIVVRTTSGVELTWSAVAAGDDHTLAIAEDGSLWAWGLNNNGQLGVNDTVTRLAPVRVGSANDWLDIDGGGAHSVGIRRSADEALDGSLWVWGDNSHGQLGDGTVAGSENPMQVGTDTSWASVFAGASSTMAVKTDQTLWGWGRNARGELGIAQNASGLESVPVQTGNASYRWAAADFGIAHSVMLTADGRLFVAGANPYGEVGNGDVSSKAVPVQVGSAGNNWTGTSLSAGWSHSTAVDSSGGLWTWGSNAYGQLGDGTRVDRDVPVQVPAGTGLTWLAVSAGAGHTAAIRADGRIFTWGDNSFGQLGRALGDNGEQCSQTPAPCGSETPGEIPQFLGFDPWVAVTAGAFHTVAITRNGELWAWGANDYGQLGIAPTHVCTTVSPCIEPMPVQVQDNIGREGWLHVAAGGDHTLGIKRLVIRDAGGYVVAEPETLWAWGRNNAGQVGDGTQTDRSVPTQISDLSGWLSVQAGGEHSYAFMRSTAAPTGSSEVWRWGSNDAGQLDIGPYPGPMTPVHVDSVFWKSAWGGGFHSAGIMADGTLWTWGLNNAGQLGNGTTGDRLIKVQIGIGSQWATAAGGYYHTLAVRSDGTLWAWGNNLDGQLGDGTAWIEAPFEIR
ncbi:MAG: hypothetical protein ACOYXU_01490 [Nitrospirota bacterium]